VEATSSPSQPERILASGGASLEPNERIPVSVGEMIKATYHVDRLIGMGSTTVVAAATRLSDQQQVALKVMREPRATAETTERFVSEASITVGLQGDHVAKVLDFGTLASGLPYVATELLEGSDLASVLERGGALRPAVAIDYAIQACEALTEAHRIGIIHRDLKTANLFLTHREDGAPVIKVLDFGISKPKTSVPIVSNPPASGASGARPPTVTGSLEYKAPEQLRSQHDVDGRADVWALGAILFELVTGHCPFAGDTTAEICDKILERPAPSLELYLPKAPVGLAAVLQRCFEKDREKRYLTANALSQALTDLLAKPSTARAPASARHGRPLDLDARDDLPALTASGKVVPRTHARTFRLRDRPQTRTPRLALIVGVAAVTTAIAGVLVPLVLRQRPPEPPPAAAETSAPSVAPPVPIATATSNTIAAEPAPSSVASAEPAASEAHPPRQKRRKPKAPHPRADGRTH
jgi:serine/threonine-protein kinase